MTTEVKPSSPRNVVEDSAKWIGILLSLLGFGWGVWSYLNTNRIQAETQQLEARKPFLDYQIKLYKEAVKAAQVIATSKDVAEKQKSTIRFWELYWGELGLVENGGIKADQGGVEGAMVLFGDCLKAPSCSEDTLHQRSLDLAHACRNSLAASYGVTEWQSPVYSARYPQPTPAPKPNHEPR